MLGLRRRCLGGGRGLNLGYWGEEAVVMVVGDIEND